MDIGDRVEVNRGGYWVPGTVVWFDDSIGVGRDLPEGIDVDLDYPDRLGNRAVWATPSGLRRIE